MLTFKEMMDKYIREFYRKETEKEIKKLEQLLFDFGFEKDEYSTTPFRLALRLPDNFFDISVSVFIYYLGHIQVLTDSPETGEGSFECDITKINGEHVFKEIYDRCSKCKIKLRRKI